MTDADRAGAEVEVDDASGGSSRNWVIRAAPVLIAVLGLLGSTLGALAWAAELDRSIDARLTGFSADAASTIEGRIGAMEQLAAATRAHLRDDPAEDADGFRTFLRSVSGQRSVGEQFPGLRALSYVVPNSSGPRQQFVDPEVVSDLAARSAASGTGLGQALAEARDLGVPILATGLEVPDSPRLEYALALPVYRQSNLTQPTATVDERRRDLQGWVVAWVDATQLVDGASARLGDAAALQLIVVGDDQAGSAVIATTPERVTIDASHPARTVLVNVRGGTIGLRTVARSGIVSPFERAQPWVFLAFGLLATAGATLLGQVLASSRQRALALVAVRTEALRQANGDLQRSNAELQEFAGIVSHDLKAPLSTTMAYLSSLERHEPLTERGQVFVTKSMRSGDRMRDLIDELLVYAKASQDVQMAADVDLDALVREVREDLTGAINQRGALLEIDRLPVLPGDPRKLQQLFQNLVGNALKFVPPERAPHVRVRAVREDALWRVAIGDNGIGIPPEQRSEVFGAFRRASGVADYAGSGLGLAICAKIVVAHGGEIRASADAELGGALIEFTLPAGLA